MPNKGRHKRYRRSLARKQYDTVNENIIPSRFIPVAWLLFDKVLAIIEINPTKYVNIRKIGENLSLKMWYKSKDTLAKLNNLARRVQRFVSETNSKLYTGHSDRIPYATDLLTTKLPLNNDTKFVIFDFLDKLTSIGKLNLLRPCDEEYLNNKNRPMTDDENKELLSLIKYVSSEVRKGLSKFIDMLMVSEPPVLTSHEYSKLARIHKSKHLDALYNVMEKKTVQQAVIVVESMLAMFEECLPGIYTLCKVLPIKKLPVKKMLAQLHTEKIKTNILTRFPPYCKAYKCCMEDKMYEAIVLNHFKSGCECYDDTNSPHIHCMCHMNM